jgi:alkylated DNA nucleotide flippase Atl1
MGRMSETHETGAGADGGPGAYAERVLETVELIPPGRVMSYGDIAEWLGEGGPRQVGHVLARYGGGVPWWRVVRADGVLLPGHELRALDAYRAEGTALRAAGPASEGHLPRVDMRRARWDGRTPGARDAGGAAGG